MPADSSRRKCAQCGREIELVAGGDVCRTCAALRERRSSGVLAFLGITVLSAVPIACGLFLLVWINSPSWETMSRIYKGGGLALAVGGPLTSFLLGVTRSRTSGVVAALVIAVLSPVVVFALFMLDFFGVFGRGWDGA